MWRNHPKISATLFAAALSAFSLAAPPHFEVATVKPSGPLDFEDCSGNGPSPGRMVWRCATVHELLEEAYATFEKGVPVFARRTIRISGEPGWVTSDHFDIEAKAEGTPPVEMMSGPMLQALLEDRFHVKVHREIRSQQPVYALTIARGGLKIQPLTQPCTHIDVITTMQLPGPPPADACATQRVGVIRDTRPPSLLLETHNMTMSEFADALTARVDRPVVDKTGVAGIFNFLLEYAFDPDSGFVPSVFSGVQRLGLKLESDKGPVEFLVIDHVEKPSEN